MLRRLSLIVCLGFGLSSLSSSAQIVDTVCAGARGEYYRTISTGGSAYQWTVAGGWITSGQNTAGISVDWGLDTGIYEITLKETSSNGCLGESVRAFVWIRNAVEANITGPDKICEGEAVVLHASGADTYLWNTGERQTSITVQPKTDFIYHVIGFAPSCGTDTAWFPIRVLQGPEAKFTVNPDDPGTDHPVDFKYTGSVPVSNYYWNIANDKYVTDTSATSYIFASSGNYDVQLIVTDSNGCSDTNTRQVIIEPGIRVDVPTAFTPGKDNLNDIFAPVYTGLKSVEMIIYNRWGGKIHESRSPDLGWDGYYQDVPVQQDVYLYVIRGVGETGKRYSTSGTVMVLR